MTADISIQINADTFKKWLHDAPLKIDRAVDNMIRKATLLVEKYAKIKGASGAYYKTHTGRLTNSIASEIRTMYGEVHTNVYYARFVHDGTRYIRPRPFLTDALKQLDAEFGLLVQEELKALE